MSKPGTRSSTWIFLKIQFFQQLQTNTKDSLYTPTPIIFSIALLFSSTVHLISILFSLLIFLILNICCLFFLPSSYSEFKILLNILMSYLVPSTGFLQYSVLKSKVLSFGTSWHDPCLACTALPLALSSRQTQLLPVPLAQAISIAENIPLSFL